MSGNHFPSGLTRRRFVAAGAAAALLFSTGALAKGEVTEKDVAIKTPDGSADAALFYPAKGKGPWPAVILWHDLPGLRPVIRDMGRKLAGAGYVVLAPNEYYRSARATGEEPDLANADIRKRYADYRTAVPDDGVARDAVAFVSYLDTLRQTATKKKVGTAGYDVGGSFAFRTAAALPDRIGAVASIHGQGVATPRPNSPHLLVPKTKAAYYVVQSREDDAREPTDKTDYEAVFAQGQLKGVVDVYPANHGFGVAGNAAYDAASAQRAWDGIVKLFRDSL